MTTTLEDGITNATPSKSDYDLYLSKKKQGVVALDFKLYIEGVQVPFNNIVVSCPYGSLPVANITLPYLPFLQEIARNYHAKVHIFFRDIVSERVNFNAGRESLKTEYKLLFNGLIKGATYQKSKAPYGSYTSISFQCVHKNALVNDIKMRFASFGIMEGTQQGGAASAQANANLTLFNPAIFAQQSMQGIDTTGKVVFDLAKDGLKADPFGIPGGLEPYASQFKGVPSIILRMWNLMCKDAETFKNVSDVMRRLYMPLMYNLQYFQTMVGHPIIETYLDSDDNRTELSEKQRQVLSDQEAATQKAAEESGTQTPTLGTINKKALNPLGAGVGALSAFSIDMTINAMIGGFQNSASVVSFVEFFNQILNSFMYSSITLASPVQRVTPDETKKLLNATTEEEKLFIIDDQATAPIETIIKPVMPIYFAPRCNVVYPRMYTSITISDMYDDAPTRIVALPSGISGVGDVPFPLKFRAPHTLRDAISQRAANQMAGIGDPKNHLDTVAWGGDTVSISETGRGVRPAVVDIPSWIWHIAPSVEGTGTASDEANGNSDPNKKYEFRKLMMQFVDYQYSLALSSYRSGSIDSVFNPYIIPGYPMDIIDPSQERPSHHAFCTSVTHSIAAQGQVNTSVSFTNVLTYEELYLFDTPVTLPWIADVLKVAAKTDKDTNDYKYTKLVDLKDEETGIKEAANKFYMDVLGVGAAFPDYLSAYKYSNQEKLPTLFQQETKELLAIIDSPEDSMAAIRRPIQTMQSVEAVYGMKFIDTEVPGFSSFGVSGLKSSYPFRATNTGGNSMTIDLQATPNGRSAPGFNAFLDYSTKEKPFVVQPADSSGPKGTAQEDTRTAGNTNPQGQTNVNSFSNYPVQTIWQAQSEKWKVKYPTHYAAAWEEETRFRQDSTYPQGLFMQLLWVESNYQPGAENSIAFGYGQLVRKFFQASHPTAFSLKEPGPINNIKAAALFLRALKRNYGFTWNDAAVAYNQGPGTVKKAKLGALQAANYNDCKLDRGGASYYCKLFDVKKTTGTGKT